MKNNKKLYQVDKQGNLQFKPLSKLHKEKYKPDSVWNHTWLLMVIIIACVITDIASFASLFSSFLYDSALLRYVCIVGMIIALEISPIYFSYNLKKRACGYNVEAISIYIPLASFVIGVIINIVLRIVTHDLVFPDLSDTTTSIIGGGGVTKNEGSSRSLVYAIFFAIVPILTSLAAMAATYTMSNPLNNERKKLEKADLEIKQNIDQMEAIISEYDADSNYLERMLSEDDSTYNAALSMIHNQRDEYFNYSRQRISEYLADPGATSYEVAYSLKSSQGEDAVL